MRHWLSPRALLAVALFVGLVVVGGVILASRGSPEGGNGALLPSDDDVVRYASIEAASREASFVFMLPSFLPVGYDQQTVDASKRELNEFGAGVHNDWITVIYRDSNGNRIVISQGFPPTLSARHAFPSQRVESGSLVISGHEAIWSAAVPLVSPFDPETDLGLVLTVYVGRFGQGWGQPGSLFSGSPMEVSIGSDSLDLEMLVTMVNSLTFPEILDPAPGVTPEAFDK